MILPVRVVKGSGQSRFALSVKHEVQEMKESAECNYRDARFSLSSPLRVLQNRLKRLGWEALATKKRQTKRANTHRV